MYRIAQRYREEIYRIEIGIYIVAALMSRGELTLTGCAKELMGAYVSVLTHIGIPIHEISPGTFHIKTPNHWGGFNIKTQEFPGFPTDLQSQFMVLATQAESPSTIQENIFDNRFMHVGELSRMGAGIFIDGSTAHIKGQTAFNRCRGNGHRSARFCVSCFGSISS